MIKPIVIVSYCSLERPFIDAILAEASKFAKQIVVAYGTLLYNGMDEDVVSVARMATRHQEVPTIFLPYHVGREELSDPIHLHNRARAMALRSSMPSDSDWILFLDGDEVPDGGKFLQYLSQAVLDESTAYKLANYWYFLSPLLRATQTEDSVLMVHASWLADAQALWHPRERDGIIIHNMASASASKRDVRRQVTSLDDGLPMFHHYSWVRSAASLRAKVQGWGHRGQRDWEALLDVAFSELHAGAVPRDFVHGYDLERCDAFPGVRLDLLA